MGVAMTPSVIRDGKVKSHMLFNAGVLLPLEDETNEFYEQALHTLAHKCAHVEVTERFNAVFPGVLLQTRPPNAHAHYRWEIVNACWDEYTVTQICAPFGQRPTEGYEKTFITAPAAREQSHQGVPAACESRTGDSRGLRCLRRSDEVRVLSSRQYSWSRHHP